MEAYSGFAEIYDRLMDDFDYPAWAEYYLSLIARKGVAPSTVCDCACGTGSISLELAAKGIRLIASDISADMLRVAGDKARARGVALRMLCCDMCTLKLPGPVDALICACDGVNYLTSENRLRRFFEAAHENLREGGVLAFDVSSPYKLTEILGEAFYGEVRDDVAYLWQNETRGGNVTMDLTFFVEEKGGLYRRVDETHRQHIWQADVLTRLLMETGFAEIEIFGDRTFEAPKPDELRWHIAAVRGE